MASSEIPQRTLNVTRISESRSSRPGLKAFTLVELLVVIVVIALLAAILAPYVDLAGEQARRADCRKRLQNLHVAAFLYASDHRNLVPLVHDGEGYGFTGRILRSGGLFASKYMEQSWKKTTGSYADMLVPDNVFQCPSAMQNSDQYAKNLGTNYRLTGFALHQGGTLGLHPNTMVIGDTVQSRAGGATYVVGKVAMAMDWIWDRDAAGLGGSYGKGKSLSNHPEGANVLYGSGVVEWVGYGKMETVSGESGLLVPPGTYGFIDSGKNGTSIFTPTGKKIPSSGKGDRKPGAGVMW